MAIIGQSQYSVLSGDKYRIALQSEQFQRLSHQLSSGKRYQYLREYGTNVSRIIDLQGVIDRRESYLRAISMVEFNIEAYQSVLEEVDEIAIQARKLSLEPVPDLNNPDALTSWRSTVSTTATLLLLQLTEVLNTNIGERYIFSGDNFRSPATIDLTTLQNFNATDVADPALLQQQTQDNMPQGSVRFEAVPTPQLTVAPGVDVDQGGAVQTQQVTIQVAGDITPEQALERFKLELGSVTPRNDTDTPSTIVENSALGYVADDDTFVSIHNLGVNEVEEGNAVVFAVRRNGGDLNTVRTVDVNTLTDAVSGALPTGYTLAGSGFAGNTVTFNANQTEVLITLTPPAVADTALNDPQKVALQLTAPSVGMSLDTNQLAADAVINDNDDLNVEYVTIAAVPPANNSEGTRERVFTITRQNPGTDGEGKSISWKIDAKNSTTDPADFGGTYPSGQVTFNAGETTKQIKVYLSDDGVLEGEERFQIEISGDRVIQSRAEGIVVDNDSSYAIRAVDAEKQEGNALGHVFRVTRQGDTSTAGSVDVSIDPIAGGVTADAASDGLVLSSATVNFAAGETEKLITVTSAGDTTIEDDEVFQLSLSNATGSTSTRIDALAATAQGTIVNDDFADLTNTIAITAVNTTPATAPLEGNQGVRTEVVFTITRTQATVATPAVGVTAPTMDEEFVTYRVVDDSTAESSADTHDFTDGYGLVPHFTATDENGVAVDQTYLFDKVVGERDPSIWQQQKVSLRDGENRSYGITAADPAFQRLIKTLLVLRSATETRNETAMKQMLAVAGRTASETVSEVRRMTADNALHVKSVDAAKKTHEFFNAMAKNKLSEITDIDPAEAAATLTTLQSQVNASYTLISKRAQLSLANFL